jgi:hypothetical protein
MNRHAEVRVQRLPVPVDRKRRFRPAAPARLSGQCLCQLAASVHVELLVGVGQMRFDGLCADEKRPGDLRGAMSFRGHGDDPGGRWGESVTAAKGGSAGSRSRGQQFLAAQSGENRCAAAVGEVEALTQRLAAVRAVSGTAERGAVVDEGAGVFKACVGMFEVGDRRLEQVDAIASSLPDQGEGAERDALGPWLVEGFR